MAVYYEFEIFTFYTQLYNYNNLQSLQLYLNKKMHHAVPDKNRVNKTIEQGGLKKQTMQKRRRI